MLLASNAPANESTELYGPTRMVVNRFSDTHHFNHRGIRAQSMNPRVYEALACGAVVVSEARPEIGAVFPALPVFSDAAQLSEVVSGLLKHQADYLAVKQACQEKLSAHSYQERLRRICETLEFPVVPAPVPTEVLKTIAMDNEKPQQQSASSSFKNWAPCGLPVAMDK